MAQVNDPSDVFLSVVDILHHVDDGQRVRVHYDTPDGQASCTGTVREARNGAVTCVDPDDGPMLTIHGEASYEGDWGDVVATETVGTFAYAERVEPAGKD